MHLAIAACLREIHLQIKNASSDDATSTALFTALALACSRLVTQHNAFAFLHSGRETIEGPWGDGKFPMSWDFIEANPLSGVGASLQSALNWVISTYENLSEIRHTAVVSRGNASSLAFSDETFDAVITDPPYYDNVSYSNLSDAFYIWLKRSIGPLYPDHFASELTPKRTEAIMAAYRHHDDKSAASKSYESMMASALLQAHRVLKSSGTLSIGHLEQCRFRRVIGYQCR